MSRPYLPAIGIECHVQLKTKTKLFSAVRNDAQDARPNSLINHIDAGLPGALPALNQQALEMAVVAAYALNTKPETFSKFDRKHYFYPDLPKGYQITQYDQPIIKGGFVEIMADGSSKKIDITRVNLEEDAGKTTHPEGADYSLVDLNRAGTPLLEIVSQPQISDARQAKAYARELWLLMKYANITDGDMYQGHVRFDVNISISNNLDRKGTRTEIKNLNSFRNVEAAVEYEIGRQTEILRSGLEIVQETRGWDEAKQKTLSQRQKEEAQDYRYFPEPDIPPLELDEAWISKILEEPPIMPAQIRSELVLLGISAQIIEDILDKPEIIHRIMEAAQLGDSKSTRRIIFDLLENPNALKISLEEHIKIADAHQKGVLNSTSATQVIVNLSKEDSNADDMIHRYSQINDGDALEQMVIDVLVNNPKAAEDIKKGEDKVIGFVVGEVMKLSRGKANPEQVQNIIKRRLKS
jgi:aspartyl-tRNA(Asn)/glutamyl-tRNA(Gln) amidotransferase subunit B